MRLQVYASPCPGKRLKPTSRLLKHWSQVDRVYIYLEAVFLSSSNMERGERQPIASHGEILQEKLAPYMLSLLPSLVSLCGWAWHSAANFLSLCNASVSPPTREALAAGLPSYMTTVDDQFYHSVQNTRETKRKPRYRVFKSRVCGSRWGQNHCIFFFTCIVEFLAVLRL